MAEAVIEARAAVAVEENESTTTPTDAKMLVEDGTLAGDTMTGTNVAEEVPMGGILMSAEGAMEDIARMEEGILLTRQRKAVWRSLPS